MLHKLSEVIMSFAEQLRQSSETKFFTAKTLSHCVALATSIGQLAEIGQQHTVSESNRDRFVGAVQVGEYILTGFIPDRELVEENIQIKADVVVH
jgi:hypothetical protein